MSSTVVNVDIKVAPLMPDEYKDFDGSLGLEFRI